MPTPTDDHEDPEPPATVKDVTCTACGCLCDDLVVTTSGGRVVEASNACPLGLRWLLADHSHSGLPEATIDGGAATVDEALDRAAAILRAARAPIVLGLTQTSSETVAAAAAVADQIGARIDPGSDPGDRARLLATQRVGRVSATLGEVKNRADVVVFWGVDPLATHPRHWERYSVEPRGRFVPDGRAGRAIIVADSTRTATAERADQFIPVAGEARFETLWTLRALLRGAALDAPRVERATGVPLDTLAGLVDRLRGARYGAWFMGPEPGGAGVVEAALGLVRDLNAFTRFVLLGLGAAGNAAGAEAVLTWQTGYSLAVDLARGSPRALLGPTSADAVLSRGLADAALVVADAAPTGLSTAARAHLGRIPRIVIAPKATAPGHTAAVAIDAATFGIDAPGTIMRTDGAVLTLRPFLAATVPTDNELLRALGDRLQPGPEGGPS